MIFSCLKRNEQRGLCGWPIVGILSRQPYPLSVILERLETTEAQRLETLYTRMAGKIRALRHEISINAGILNSLQAFIRKGLNVMRQATAPLGLYSESGAPHECGMDALMFRQKG